NLDIPVPVPEFKIPMKIQEVVFLYGPENETCQLLSAKSLTLSLDKDVLQTLVPEEAEKEAAEKIPEMTLLYKIGSLTFDNYDLSPLLETPQPGFLELIMRLVSSERPVGSTAEDFTFAFQAAQKEKTAWVSASIQKTESRGILAPEVLAAFFKKEEQGTVFSALLEEGRSPLDLEYAFHNLSLTVKAPEADITAEMGALKAGYSVRPTQAKDAFSFGLDFRIQGLDTSGLKKKEVEALLGLEDMKFHLSVDGLSADFLDGFIDLIRTVQASSLAKDRALQQQVGMKTLALTGAFMKTKPTITLSLLPFEHRLARIEAEGRFQFSRPGPPVGKATVTLRDFAKLAEKLKQEQVFPAEAVDGVLAKLRTIFVTDTNGHGVLTFEIKEEDPSHFYLNGKPHAFSSPGK
ncbi:MAG: hypothetical protein ACE5LV_10105, partial [Candidatus Aminicenantales bacterium]